MTIIQGIDFTKRAKDVLVIKLPDGEGDGFEVSILPPTKAVHDQLVALAGVIDDLAAGTLAPEDVDLGAVYKAVSDAMNRNTELRRITPGYLESIGFDMMDAADFLGIYLFFITELVKEKN